MRTFFALSIVVGLLVGLVTGFLTTWLTGAIAAVSTIVIIIALVFLLGVYLSFTDTPERAFDSFIKWLSSDNEFGRQPDHCEITHHAELPWPMDGESQKIYLCRYAYNEDGKIEEGLGLAGYTNWTFFGVSSDELSPQDWVRCYRGWYVLLAKMAEGGEQEDLADEEWRQLSSELTSVGFDVSRCDRDTELQIARLSDGEVVYAAKAVKGKKDVVAVGVMGKPKSIETRDLKVLGVPVGHYHYLDSWWTKKFGIDPAIKVEKHSGVTTD